MPEPVSASRERDQHVERLRDGIGAYWDAPSEYHSSLDWLVSRLDELERERDAALDALREKGSPYPAGEMQAHLAMRDHRDLLARAEAHTKDRETGLRARLDELERENKALKRDGLTDLTDTARKLDKAEARLAALENALRVALDHTSRCACDVCTGARDALASGETA
jgi:DNA repair exonuclease SbcCD ATPase subunit